MVRRCSKNLYEAPRAATAFLQASAEKWATAWKEKANRLRTTRRLARVFLPCQKLCLRLYPPVLRTLKVSFLIFHLARPQAARSATVSAVTGRSVTKEL